MDDPTTKSKQASGQPSKKGGEERLSADEWLRTCKDEALRINPATAEVIWDYCFSLDPYGVYEDLLDEEKQVGREYFARAPDSDIWVWVGDLPKDVEEKLWGKHRKQLAFPAGLPFVDPSVEIPDHLRQWLRSQGSRG